MGTPLGSPHEISATGRAVRTMFAAVAPRYDFLNHFLSLGRDITWRRATARELSEYLARPGSVALDACCGTGDLSFALAAVSAGRVIGADFCHPMLQLARQKAAKIRPHRTGSKVHKSAGSRSSSPMALFIEADTLALPLAENSLDVVTSAFGFRNLANYGRGLEEMRRVLKPGGILAILEFSRIRWPVVGPMFRLYFRRLLPRLGTWISGVSGPYQYLPDSVGKFPDQESLAGAMRSAGFKNVHYRNFFFGASALHVGEKA